MPVLLFTLQSISVCFFSGTFSICLAHWTYWIKCSFRSMPMDNFGYFFVWWQLTNRNGQCKRILGQDWWLMMMMMMMTLLFFRSLMHFALLLVSVCCLAYKKTMIKQATGHRKRKWNEKYKPPRIGPNRNFPAQWVYEVYSFIIDWLPIAGYVFNIR